MPQQLLYLNQRPVINRVHSARFQQGRSGMSSVFFSKPDRKSNSKKSDARSGQSNRPENGPI
jgi:hypothetical protein